MDSAYAAVAMALAARSINAYPLGEDQLVIARQEDPTWPDKGNSFWITWAGGHWYVCTWVPVCYRIPATVDIVDLCTDFVDRGDTAQRVIPDDLILKYSLIPLGEEESRRSFGY